MNNASFTLVSKSFLVLGFSCFFSFLSYNASAQTPGGNTSLTTELWLSADKVNTVIPAEGATVIEWKDLSTNGRHFVKSGTYLTPTYRVSTMNFQPALDFYDAAGNTTANQGRKLVSSAVFPVALDRAYYTFWVSELSTVLASATSATVFSFGTGTGAATGATPYNDVGWTTAGLLRHSTRSTSLTFAGTTMPKYGIGTAIVPNVSTAGVLQRQYHNGVLTTATMTANPMRNASYTASVATLGNYSAAAGFYFYGKIQEVIVLSGTLGTHISDDDRNRVQSYLAIKYGQTLGGTADYYSTDATPTKVWTRSDVTGYEKAIFGIGRDDAGGLNQKQATSYDNKTITAYLGAELKATNSANTETFATDKTYLMFSSNELTSITPYIHAAGENFSYDGSSALDTKLNFRSNRILRVQTTGSAPDISIDVHIEASHLLVSSGAAFAPATTRVYPLVNGSAQNVKLHNGDYIGFALYAPTPGGTDRGVLDIALWLSADKLSGKATTTFPLDGDNVPLWKDRSEYYRDFINSGTLLTPVFRKSTLNFQPAMDFYDASASAAANQSRKLVSRANFPLDKTKAYYTFWVSELSDVIASSAQATVFSFGTGTGTTTATPCNDVGWTTGGLLRAAVQGIDHNLSLTSTRYGIGSAIIPNSGVAQQYYYNGSLSTATGTATQLNMTMYATATYTASTAVLGNSTASTADYFFGKIQEVIVLTPSSTVYINTHDLNRIQSYLAIKYGITLGTGDYVNSAATPTTVWTRTAGYEQAIFGLARDDASGLYQKQATSSVNKTVTAYLGTDLKASNKENTESFTSDNTYIMFSSNELIGLTPYDYAAGYPFDGSTLGEKINHMNRRILRVQTVGTDLPEVSLDLNLDASYVLVSTSPSFTPANTRIYPVTNHSVHNVSLHNGEYIGFASYVPTPGGTNAALLNTELWLQSDKVDIILPSSGSNVLKWNDFSIYSRNFVKYSSAAVPVMNYAGLNYQPAVEFRSTLGTAVKLVTQSPFPISIDNAYYTFWVSEVDKAHSSAGGSVLSFDTYGTATTTNYVARVNTGQTRLATQGTNNAFNFANAAITTFPEYAIGTAIVPNDGTATSTAIIF